MSNFAHNIFYCRFVGLRAAIFTKCPAVRSLASNLGFTVFQLDELIKKTDSSDEFIQDASPTKRCYIFKDVLQALIDAEVLKLRQEQKRVTRQYNVYSI